MLFWVLAEADSSQASQQGYRGVARAFCMEGWGCAPRFADNREETAQGASCKRGPGARLMVTVALRDSAQMGATERSPEKFGPFSKLWP